MQQGPEGAVQDPILIAGGGIGGLAAALALARQGRPVHVLERAPEFREIGAGLQLGPNAFAMLERLGLAAAVLESAVEPDALVLRSALDGHEILRLPFGSGFAARFGGPVAVIHRADLHGVLLRACRAEPSLVLETGVTLADIAEDDAGVTAVLEGGGTRRGAALVGADGLWSRVRGWLLDDGKPVATGHVACRAVLPMEAVPREFRRREVALWAGPRLHLLHYPLRRGELMNLVAVFESDWAAEGWDDPGDAGALARAFAVARPELRALLERAGSWGSWMLCDREPRRGWSRGRVTLLGDAAHPMLHYLAQGAAMAIEDSLCLADQLALHGEAAPALAAYEAARVLRAGRVQAVARLHGELYHAEGVKAELRDEMLGRLTAEAGWDALAWLYATPRWPA
jgi:salicylate hydroxylase